MCMATFENNSRGMDCRSFSYRVVGAHDTPTYNVTKHFDEIHDFISRGRIAGAVFVHCMAGISRAATAVLVHLMRSERIPLLIAFRQLKAARPCVHPNDGFWRALQNEERRLLIHDNASAPDKHYASTAQHAPPLPTRSLSPTNFPATNYFARSLSPVPQEPQYGESLRLGQEWPISPWPAGGQKSQSPGGTLHYTQKRVHAPVDVGGEGGVRRVASAGGGE